MQDQADKLRKMLLNKSQPADYCGDNKRARVITITSGKGGVGKTNLTVNLALALKKLGQKVLIIDADFGMANIDVILGCSARYNILHILDGGYAIEDVISQGPYGINFIAGGSGIYGLANLDSLQLNYLSAQFNKLDSLADIILIDTGAGLNNNVMNFVMAADEVIIITTSEPTAITDAYAIMKAYATKAGKNPVKLLINKVMNDEEGFEVIDKLTHVAYRFLKMSLISLGYVYEDRNVVRAVKQQTPLLIAYPNCAAAKCIENIAQKLLFHQITPDNGGMKGFFRKILGKMW